ncbi:MAG: DUF4350 domain-containing protein [Pirellulales bacterium]
MASLAGLAAGWIAAGSAGLMAYPLRHALTWLALGVATVAAWPEPNSPWNGRWRILKLAIGILLAVAMTASSLVPVNVLAVAIALAALAQGQSAARRQVILVASVAVASLGVYRLADTSIPTVWMATDAVAGAIGRLAGAVAGRPLSIGATFGGIDFLVAMAALYAGWLFLSPPPRLPRALWAALGILAGQLVYLIVLAFAADLLAMLPAATPEEAWTWKAAVRSLVPWNLPALAGVIQLLVAGAMFRWSAWVAETEAAPATETPSCLRTRRALLGAAAFLAAAMPMAATLWLQTPSLKDKKIVLYEEGFLNWLKPEHGDYGRLGQGMYGMLPIYIKSLGGTSVTTTDLEKNLPGAAALVLLYPNKPWPKDALKRIQDFVENGGSLLVMGEHTVREADGGSRFNDVLEHTAMRVPFDSATFEVGGWLQSYDAMAHPATAGIRDEKNQFGVVIGASVEAHWPARPLLIGRWGFNDPGDPGNGEAMMGNHRYDSGERLGDVLLAAEQPVGKGKIVVFGDTSGVTNGINVGTHEFTSRLLAYLADGPANPRAMPRQVLAILLGLGLVGLLLWQSEETRVALAALVMAASLVACTAATYRANEILPDGRLNAPKPNNLAYIDTSHLEAQSDESWRDDGTMGMALTLMRNGFLTLALPEITAARLERAAILVSVAPSREFSAAERQTVRQFIEDGGIFIVTVGYEEIGPSRKFLSELGFTVGADPDAREPEPLGHFKSQYPATTDHKTYVRFHAAWPIQCRDPNAQVIAYGAGDVPVIMVRPMGKGQVVVVGDTGFAMNKNLEREGGEPFEGMRENADFWRWFLARLTGGPAWVPPAPPPPPAAPANAQDSGSAAGEVTP